MWVGSRSLVDYDNDYDYEHDDDYDSAARQARASLRVPP